jgi:NADH:ubiquinone reductase (H+-translocating)
MTKIRDVSVTNVVAVAEGRRPRVVIIGGGFAGINAAKALANSAVDVTLIDRCNHHTFQPLLYQVALAVLTTSDIATPIRGVLRHARNVEILMDEVVNVDTKHRHVILGSGLEIEYDYLIVATGSTHSYFGHNDWEQHAPGLKTTDDALEIRRRVLLAFELAEREALAKGTHPELNFVVIGAGPTGVELAGAIAEISRLFLSRDFRHIDPKQARTMLIEAGPRILPAYPEDLSIKALTQLRRLGVEVLTGTQVQDIQCGFVLVNGGERINANVTLWAAGVAASPLGKMLGVETDRRGRVIVGPTLNPAGHSEIFICGDLANFVQDGGEVPGVAQPAMQMGAHAGRMILQDLRKEARTHFRYFDKGDMATIGRFSAVANIKWPFRARWGGLIAWFTWLTVHLAFIISYRNRMSVLFQWAWTYLFYLRGSRLITGNQSLKGQQKQQPTRVPLSRSVLR